ncbi:OmpA family protein [Arcicella rosea]|uniref:Outer membrane protein OmpA-like peptidoglycan-associated protein n=1 Tax=Arcicella rosea TaxID=502909 RepID=A0A841ELT5_9BACT|nr:OmpA family protein [Arcicella rosea]MBB6002389.1 outer membrane protein OmpA-like peptidoglycan-associated protein [Arcicella rosea]
MKNKATIKISPALLALTLCLMKESAFSKNQSTTEAQFNWGNLTDLSTVEFNNFNSKNDLLTKINYKNRAESFASVPFSEKNILDSLKNTSTKTSNTIASATKTGVQNKTVTVNFTAINKANNESVLADFIITSERTGEIFKGNTSSKNTFFPIQLSQQDNLKVLVKADGFADGNSMISIKDFVSTNHHDFAIPLVFERYPLSIKVLDADTKESIKNAQVKVVDLNASEIKNASKKSNSDEYSANLKLSSKYEFIINAEDYIELKEKVLKAPQGNSVNFMLYKNSLPVHFEVIDAETEKPVKAFINIKLEHLKRNIIFKNEAKASVRVSSQEIFTVETAAEHYITKQSTFNMADFNPTKKYVYTIRLERNLHHLTIKTKNKLNGENIIADKIELVNLSNKANQPKTEKLKNGDVLISLIPEDKYHLEINTNGFEKYQQEFIKLKQVELDCFLTPKQKIKGLVLSAIDSTSGKIIPATFNITGSKTKKNFTVYTSNDVTEYHLALTEKDNYQIESIAKDYELKVEQVQYLSSKKTVFYTVVLKRKPSVNINKSVASLGVPKTKATIESSKVKDFIQIESGQSITLDNVYFEQSSFILQSVSYQELDKMVELLKNAPQVKIEISGHTDNIGDTRLNFALSENRARVVFNYFVSKGIHENRLKYKGYGSNKPLLPNNSEENKKKNRRVELTVL